MKRENSSAELFGRIYGWIIHNKKDLYGERKDPGILSFVLEFYTNRFFFIHSFTRVLFEIIISSTLNTRSGTAA